MQKDFNKIFLFLALTIMIVPFPSNANEPLVFGSVKSIAGKPIKGLPVIIENEQSSKLTFTDKNGKFQFKKLPAGDYTIAPASDPDIYRKVTIEENKMNWWQLVQELNWWQLVQERKFNSINGSDIEFAIETGRKY